MATYTISIQTVGYGFGGGADHLAAIAEKLAAANLPAPFQVIAVPVHGAEGGINIDGADSYERDAFCEAVSAALGLSGEG